MKRPHFDVLLHREELGRPQQVQEQIRNSAGNTSVDRIIKEQGESKKPASNLRRLVEWLVVLCVIIALFLWWIL